MNSEAMTGTILPIRKRPSSVMSDSERVDIHVSPSLNSKGSALKKVSSRPVGTGAKSVSRILDSLRDSEKRENANGGLEDVTTERLSIPDRRCATRVWINSPVLVYGHTIENEPFHEGTEALHVNARGGLITLTSTVSHGQTLILINKVNQREQKCRVVSQRSSHLKRAAVVVGFPEPVPKTLDIELSLLIF